MLWKLVVFMKNSSVYIDSRTAEDVNTTSLQSSSAWYREYHLVTVQSHTLRRYASGLSVILSRAVLRSDLTHITEVLTKTWTETGMEVFLTKVEPR
jgi:hypothetical protein